MSETWFFNEFISVELGSTAVFNVSFSTDDTKYTKIAVANSGAAVTVGYDNLNVYYRSFVQQTGWTNPLFRTIVLDSPATGDFLTWLQNNAVKQ